MTTQQAAYTSSMSQFTREPGTDQESDSGAQKKPLTGSSQTRTRKSAGAFRTISEVAKELGVQQHVLRFWETKFSQVRPLKRGGGRRYYRPEDVVLLKRIHELLYTEGYTIKGVQKLLREQGKNGVLNGPTHPAVEEQSEDEVEEKAPGLSASQKRVLESMLGELKALRELVQPQGSEEQ